MDKIRHLVKDTRGANLVEYMMLVGLIALAAITAFSHFGGSVKTKIQHQMDTVNGINDSNN